MEKQTERLKRAIEFMLLGIEEWTVLYWTTGYKPRIGENGARAAEYKEDVEDYERKQSKDNS